MANWAQKIPPQTGIKLRLHLAAGIWLVGVFMVGRFAYLLLADINWLWWAVIAGILLGVTKGSLIMIPNARKCIQYIQSKPKSWLFDLFLLRTWIIFATMMGGGMLLRRLGSTEIYAYNVFLAILYLTVTLGLLISSTLYWQQFLKQESD